MSPSNKPHDIQFRLPTNKMWIKQELVRIGQDNGFPLSQLVTLILSSWVTGRGDSTPRPQRPERCALTRLRYSP